MALQFLTRIKISKNLEMTAELFRLSTFYFPFVGLMIGVILYFGASLGEGNLQPLTLATLLLILEIVITGGLHIDGLMDTCDGILSGREREKILEIMKDSRVGAMGVISLCLLLLLKVVFLYEIVLRDDLYMVLFMPFVGRWAMIYALTCYPSARSEGLGHLFRKKLNKKSFFLISLYSLIILSFSFYYLSDMMALIWPLTALMVYFTAERINLILGGHTGDTYGAISELAEMYFLGSFLILINI